MVKKADSYWAAAEATFTGTATDRGSLNPPRQLELSGTLSLAVLRDKVAAILSPNSESTPALWMSFGVTEMKMEASGSQGLFRKRPTKIRLDLPNGHIVLHEVSQIFREIGRFQSGQEGKFIKVLER